MEDRDQAVFPASSTRDQAAVRWLLRGGWAVIGVELVLGLAHFLWPEYRWGQGRRSYFNLDNSLTLASWLSCAQLFVVSGFALLAYRRERSEQMPGAWVWVLGAATTLGLSIAEMTRFHQRLGFSDYPEASPYGFSLVFGLWLLLLVLFAWFLLLHLQRVRMVHRYALGWLAA